MKSSQKRPGKMLKVIIWRKKFDGALRSPLLLRIFKLWWKVKTI